MPKKKPVETTTSVKKREKRTLPRSFSELVKELKLEESYMSLLLGLIVVLIIGGIILTYIQNLNALRLGEAQKDISSASTQEEKEKILGAYTIEQGDDLKRISEKFYNSSELYLVIAKKNNISNPDVIEVGMKLLIPKVEKKQFLAELLSLPVNKAPIVSPSYTVQEGDFLWDIALRAYGDGTKWEGIAKTNNLSTTEAIFPGMILQIPH